MFDPFGPVLEDVLGDFTAFSPKSSFTSSSGSRNSFQPDLTSVNEADDAKPSCQATDNTSVHHLFADSAFDSYESDYGLASSDIRATLPDSEMLSPNSSHNGSHHGHDTTLPQPMPHVPEMPQVSHVPQAQIKDFSAQSRGHLHKSMLIQLASRAVRMASFHHDFNAFKASAADMNILHEEFNTFASEMSQMANEFNARLIKMESERDELRKALSQQSQQLKLQQYQQEHQYHQEDHHHQEYNQEQQQTQSYLPDATNSVSQTPNETGSGNMRFHDDDDDMLLTSPVTPSSKGLPADFSSFTVPAMNPYESSPFGPKLTGLKKPKSERTSARKALKIKIPGGPIPMASLKSGVPARPAKSADARLQETVASPLPFVNSPASAPMPFAIGSPSATSPFAPGPSSCGMEPPSPFMAAQSSMGLETPSRVITAPSPSGMETPTRYVTGSSSPFVTVPSSSGMTPRGHGVGILSSIDMATPAPFMAGPPTSAVAAPTKFINYRPADSIDLSPLTPDRIGPDTAGDPRTVNSVLRRRLNNLVGLLPPSTAFIPEVPLTDTELIVFFFQSLSRPEVSLRLYARKWGPQTITAALNKHRNIEGGYLRNTTSVKCTSAIKKGRDKHGDDWYEENKAVFAGAGDWLATQLIRQTGEEAEKATDFELSSLDTQLKQYPLEGVDGGIFTRCVKWCCERKGTANARYTLKNVHELVVALRWGEYADEPSQ